MSPRRSELVYQDTAVRPVDHRRVLRPLDEENFAVQVTLSATSAHPVYVQIQEQIRVLIESAQLAAGTRLPAARELADNLGINRNTVLAAYTALARSGWVEFQPGRGTFVKSRVGRDQAPATIDAFLDAIDEPLRAALAVGLAPEELARALLQRAQMLTVPAPVTVTAGFFECNRDRLEYYTAALGNALDMIIEPVLIAELDQPGESAARLATCDFLVTTFFHLAEVRRKLQRFPALTRLELFTIAVQPHLSVLSQLAGLPPGSVLGIVYCEDEHFTERRLAAMKEAIAQAHLRNIAEIRTLLVSGAPEEGIFRDLDAVLVRPENTALLRDWLPGHLLIIEFANVLDAASVHMLEEVAHAFREAKQRTEGGFTRAADALVR